MMTTGERDGSSVEATARLLAAATFGGGAAASHYAACEVVAGEDDLEVVGDDGAHVAVGVAYLALRLVGLHQEYVGRGAYGIVLGRAVLLPPDRRELRLLLEGGADGLLLFGVGVGEHMSVGAEGLACALVDRVDDALLGAQLARDGLNVCGKGYFCHSIWFFNCYTNIYYRGAWVRAARIKRCAHCVQGDVRLQKGS